MLNALLLASLLAADPPAAEPVPDWKTYGWSVSDAPPQDDTCPFASPSLDPAIAVWTVGHAPDQVPRPSVRCSDAEIVLPIPPTDGFLVRREGPKPSVEWALNIDATRQGTARVLRVDLPPLATDAADPKSADIPLGGLHANGALTIAPVPMRLPNRQPNRHEFPNAVSTAEPPPPPLLPTLVATPIAQIEEDGLVATPDDGKHWYALGLMGPLARVHHMLRAGNVMGAGGTLYVTPRALHVHAATHVYRMDPATGAFTDLGSPLPADAAWSVRVTDVREREGRPEILVSVDTAPPTGRGKANWGAFLRRENDGWVELSRFFAPELDEELLPTLRFDRARADRALFLSEHLRLERPLKLPPPAP
jgi:hypothetical protein